MLGEYKTEGGKLVRAELEVEDGVICGLQISGDFFLEPPEALQDITGALQGAPATLGHEELAGRVRAALGPEVEMIGFSPEAVATAVGRAIDGG